MRPDSSGLATLTCFYVLLKRVKPLTEKRTLKASFFSRKATRKGGKISRSPVCDLTAVVSLANQII